MNEDRELVLAMLMDLKETHPHSLYAAGMDPTLIKDMDTILEQVRDSERMGERIVLFCMVL